MEQSKALVSFSKLSKSDQKLFLDEKFKNHNITLGKELRKLTDEELLNRDYYRGRFCSNSYDSSIYNWE